MKKVYYKQTEDQRLSMIKFAIELVPDSRVEKSIRVTNSNIHNLKDIRHVIKNVHKDILENDTVKINNFTIDYNHYRHKVAALVTNYFYKHNGKEQRDIWKRYRG